MFEKKFGKRLKLRIRSDWDCMTELVFHIVSILQQSFAPFQNTLPRSQTHVASAIIRKVIARKGSFLYSGTSRKCFSQLFKPRELSSFHDAPLRWFRNRLRSGRGFDGSFFFRHQPALWRRVAGQTRERSEVWRAPLVTTTRTRLTSVCP